MGLWAWQVRKAMAQRVRRRCLVPTRSLSLSSSLPLSVSLWVSLWVCLWVGVGGPSTPPEKDTRVSPFLSLSLSVSVLPETRGERRGKERVWEAHLRVAWERRGRARHATTGERDGKIEQVPRPMRTDPPRMGEGRRTTWYAVPLPGESQQRRKKKGHSLILALTQTHPHPGGTQGEAKDTCKTARPRRPRPPHVDDPPRKTPVVRDGRRKKETYAWWVEVGRIEANRTRRSCTHASRPW